MHGGVLTVLSGYMRTPLFCPLCPNWLGHQQARAQKQNEYRFVQPRVSQDEQQILFTVYIKHTDDADINIYLFMPCVFCVVVK